jgi:hypothetical protein
MSPELNDKLGKRINMPRSKAKKGPTQPHVGHEVRDLPLVEQNGLSFRIIAGARDELAHEDFDAAVVAELFRVAFNSVWVRIPTADRQRLLTYWRRGPDVRSATLERDKYRGPLIRVVCGFEPPDDVITGCGMEINFPASLVVGQPLRLVEEVARALAGVHRLATREHWSLILEQIDEPFDLWEGQEGADATDDRWDKKLDELEAEYLRRFRARIGQIIQTWGIEASRSE